MLGPDYAIPIPNCLYRFEFRGAMTDPVVAATQGQLNKMIEKLQQTLAANLKLEKRNKELEDSLEDQTSQSVRVSRQNCQFKLDLERMSVEREQSFGGHQRLKTQLNETMKICREQSEEIAILKRGLENHRAISIRGTASMVFQNSVIEQDSGHSQEIAKLKAEIKRLENDLFQSYDIIDELEFELEQVAFLEAENERLHEELRANHTASDDIQHVNEARPSLNSLWHDDDKFGAHQSTHRSGDDDSAIAHDDASIQLDAGLQLLQRTDTASAEDGDATAATSSSPAATSTEDNASSQDDDAAATKRRMELRKKLEKIHENHAQRSMDLIARLRPQSASLTFGPNASNQYE